MAVQSRLHYKREDSANLQSQQARDGISINWTQPVQLEYYDDADPSFTGENITAVEAASNVNLPRVGRQVYYENGFVIPFLICTGKQARRATENKRFWNVTLNWSGRGQPVAVAPPTSVTDITPVVEYIADETSMVVYADNNDKKCLTPTGNFFDEEFRKYYGVKRVRITQHEASLTHDAMAARKRKCNSTTYRGEGAWYWQIMDVQAKDVTIQLAAGPTAAVLVEYDILGNTSLNNWRDSRALIDSHYLTSANDLTTKKPHYSEELKSYTSVMLNLDGTIKSDQTTPLYDLWEIQDTLDFNTFLRA